MAVPSMERIGSTERLVLEMKLSSRSAIRAAGMGSRTTGMPASDAIRRMKSRVVPERTPSLAV